LEPLIDLCCGASFTKGMVRIEAPFMEGKDMKRTTMRQMETNVNFPDERKEKRVNRREKAASAGLVISTMSILGFLYYVLQNAYQNPGLVEFTSSPGIY
jgi:hypothetical protein